MGRWSQYRHRGRGNPASAAGFPLAAPVSGNWEWTSLSEEIDASMLAGCPIGVNEIITQFRIVGDPDWTDGSLIACGDTAIIVPACTIGVDYEGRIAWSFSGTQMSDWSAPKTVTCSA